MALPARDENQDAAGPCRHASSIVSIRPMSQPSLPNGHAPPMIEARPVEVEGTPPEQRLQPFVIERVAGDHKGRGGGYADCEVFRENLPDYIHACKLHPIDHRGQFDIANATSLRAFSDDAMTPRRCCKSSTARCPPNPTAGCQLAGQPQRDLGARHCRYLPTGRRRGHQTADDFAQRLVQPGEASGMTSLNRATLALGFDDRCWRRRRRRPTRTADGPRSGARQRPRRFPRMGCVHWPPAGSRASLPR
jgi:hypothetical protein